MELLQRWTQLQKPNGLQATCSCQGVNMWPTQSRQYSPQHSATCQDLRDPLPLSELCYLTSIPRDRVKGDWLEGALAEDIGRTGGGCTHTCSVGGCTPLVKWGVYRAELTHRQMRHMHRALSYRGELTTKGLTWPWVCRCSVACSSGGASSSPGEVGPPWSKAWVIDAPSGSITVISAVYTEAQGYLTCRNKSLMTGNLQARC